MSPRAQSRGHLGVLDCARTDNIAKVYLQHQKEDFNKMPKAPKYLN